MQRRSVAYLLAVVLLAGCSSRAMLGMSRVIGTSAEKDLAGGIRAYENGEYEDAERLLQRSLDEKLTFKSDRINAYKYLAFVHCVSNEERKCRDDFRKVFELDPR